MMSKQGVVIIEATDMYVRMVCIQANRLCHFDAVLRTGPKFSLQGMSIPKKYRSFGVILVMPRREIIFKLLDLPSGHPEELRRMVDVQIASQVPYAKEEMEYSFDILQTLKNGHSRILVGVIHKTKVDHYLQELQSQGLQVGQIIVSSIAIIKACGDLNSKIQEEGACYAVLNVDQDHSELCLSIGGRIVFSKHLSAGFDKVIQTESPVLVHEAMRVLHSFTQTYSEIYPKGIMLVAPQPCRDVLIRQLQQNSDYEVGIIDASKQEPCEGADLSKWETHFGSGSAAMLLGAVGAETVSKINLLPAVSLRQKGAQKSRRIRNRFFISLVFAGISLTVVLNIHFIRQQVYLSKLQNVYEQIRPGLREAQETADLISIVRDNRSQGVYVASLLEELFVLTPDEVTYRDIQMGRDGMLILQGESRSSGGVSLLQKNLVASDVFQDEMLRYATKRKRFREEITEFRMTCRVKF